MNCSPPGSSIHGIYQARVLKWVADFLQGSPQPRNQPPVSCVGRQVLYHWTTREAQYTSLQNSKKCPLRDVTSGDQLHKAGQFSSGILNMEGLIVSKIWYYQAKKKKERKNTVRDSWNSSYNLRLQDKQTHFPLGLMQFKTLSTSKFLRLQLILCQDSHKSILHKKPQRCLPNIQLF